MNFIFNPSCRMADNELALIFIPSREQWLQLGFRNRADVSRFSMNSELESCIHVRDVCTARTSQQYRLIEAALKLQDNWKFVAMSQLQI
jgi:hypothetical protein